PLVCNIPPFFLLPLFCPVLQKRDKNIRLMTGTKEAIPLDMADPSVDDMYIGCSKKMETKVNNSFFKKEIKTNFSDIWKKAQTCAKRPTNIKLLTTNHRQAICVYTSNNEMFYQSFNSAVRTQRKAYGTSFPFHSLHFWLTDALKILNKEKECLTTYRRTNLAFTGNVGQLIRLGSFVSTSKLSNLIQFGTKTCFKIRTCLGAYLEKLPALKDQEQEVLVPPYELFKITEKDTTGKKIYDCETVYNLQYAGVHSNLNCYQEPIEGHT
uniref:NAD(P)(+)--arginine ADP-ribosyltransferase n=1 Tax=Oryzias sinensis TaxID=183150 RepID=A0A8C7XQW2_9TELE